VEMSDDRLEISPLTFDPRERSCAPKSSFIYVLSIIYSLLSYLSYFLLFL